MEDPIKFDAWGVVKSGGNFDAAQFVQLRFPEVTRLGALQRVNRSKSTGQAMLLASRLGWADIQCVLNEVASFADEVRVYQSGYGPEEEKDLSLCGVHHLYYGGCGGCPVCAQRSAM